MNARTIGGRRTAGARATRWLALTILALSALVVETPAALAQWGDGFFGQEPEGYASPPPRQRARESSRDDGYGSRRRYAPQQQETQRQFFWPWEERPPQAQPVPRPAPTYSRPSRPRPTVASPPRPPVAASPPRPPVAASPPRLPVAAANPDSRPVRKRVPRPTPAVVERQAPVEKTTPATQVAVFGDSLASYLSKGLDQAFEDNPDVAIVDRSRGDSGIMRKDVVDWARTAEEYLKANPKVGYALVMVGVNDRQPIREGDQSYEAFSEKWREIYAGRVDALVKVFVDGKIPLIWVNLPPMRSESLSRDLAAINDIVRERVQKAGQSYVDVWPGFVDERNRFAANGPDVDGQEAKLRTSDGIHFTAAGSRKIAHFADVELKRLMGARGGPPAEQPAPVAATPGTATGEAASPGLDDTVAIDRKITAMLPSLPEPPGIPTLPVKPAAGPVVPLSRAETSPGGALIGSRPRDGDAAGTVERSLQRGVAPMPRPGRADDFKWPPG